MIGEGHPLVMIHGELLNSREWDSQFKELTKEYKVIRYDVRGYGKSETPRTFFSNSEDLYSLLQYLKVEKVSLMGASIGGGIAVDFALDHPEMVDAIITVGALVGGFNYSDQFIQRSLEIRRPLYEEDGVEKVVANWLDDRYLIPAPEFPAARRKFREILMENLHVFSLPHYLVRRLRTLAIRRLSEIRVPTLIIVGELDIRDVLLIADTLKARIAGSKKKVIQGAGHLVSMERPVKFNRVLLNFLRDLEN